MLKIVTMTNKNARNTRFSGEIAISGVSVWCVSVKKKAANPKYVHGSRRCSVPSKMYPLLACSGDHLPCGEISRPPSGDCQHLHPWPETMQPVVSGLLRDWSNELVEYVSRPGIRNACCPGNRRPLTVLKILGMKYVADCLTTWLYMVYMPV